MRRLLLATGLVALLAGAGSLSTRSRAEPSVRSLDVVVARPDGSRILLQFSVSASSEEDALQAAVSATRQLVPAGVILEDPEVSAQFAPWWWQWDATELPVPVAYNPSGAIDGVAGGAVSEALSPWSNVPTSSFAFVYAGATSLPASLQAGAADGVNVVAWEQLDCHGGCVLGVTTKMDAHETDVVLNSNPQARLGDGSKGTVDARSVLLHEAGHMAGLEHSCPLFSCSSDEQDAVMYFQYRGVKRALRADDVAGVSALYPVARSNPQLSSLQLEVAPGWALTALPPGPIEAAMESLACVDAVYAYRDGEWDVWIRGLHTSFQRLTWVESGAAYWIHAGAACSHLFILD